MRTRCGIVPRDVLVSICFAAQCQFVLVNSNVRPQMSSSRSEPSRLVKCEKCGVPVAEHRLKKHMKLAHNPEKEAALSSALAQRRVAEARTKLLARVIKCPACGAGMKLSKVKYHFGNTHASPAPLELLKLIGEPVENLFKSGREREAYWREESGISYEEESHDLFDRTKVLSGGAYGLGKSRKH